ncbi:MAG: hypothetical protein K0Q63_1812 [Paenibacillus sp.]|nr:hypothetical protein [Paenibacillus sp.]
MSLALTLDFQYRTTIEKLWAAVTDSEKLEISIKPDSRTRMDSRAQDMAGALGAASLTSCWRKNLSRTEG